MHSPSEPLGLVLESSANCEAVTQWILNRPVRGGDEAFKDCPIEVTDGDANSFEPILGLTAHAPNVYLPSEKPVIPWIRAVVQSRLHLTSIPQEKGR